MNIVIVLAAVVIGFLLAKIGQKKSVRQDIQQDIQPKNELKKMRELQTRINLLASQCEKGQIRDMLQNLAEEVQYSNPVSKDISEEIEEEIIVLFAETEAAALDEDIENTAKLCDRMKGLLKERDRICKYGT